LSKCMLPPVSGVAVDRTPTGGVCRRSAGKWPEDYYVRSMSSTPVGKQKKAQLFWVYGDPHRKYVDSWIRVARDQRCIPAGAAAAATDLHLHTSWPVARRSFPSSSRSAPCCLAASPLGSA